MKNITDEIIKRVVSEPGDFTRYDYLVYQLPLDNTEFRIAPCNSSFPYPQRLDIFEAEVILNQEDPLEAAIAFIRNKPALANVNPHTLVECCKTIKDLYYE